MTSAGPWGAVPQAEAFARNVEQTAEKVGDHLPQKVGDSIPFNQSGSSTFTDTSSDLDKETSAQEVAKLARQITQQTIETPAGEERLGRTTTVHSIKTVGGGDYQNSFLDTSVEQLDPGSKLFKPEAWVRTLIGLQSRDPERYPQRVAGVAYRNLNVHGFGSLTDYQK